MCSTLRLSVLIIYTLHLLARDALARGEEAGGNTEIATANNDRAEDVTSHREDGRRLPRRLRVEEGEESLDLGENSKRRSNGESMEPIWRDGDAVPPLPPFSPFSRFDTEREPPRKRGRSRSSAGRRIPHGAKDVYEDVNEDDYEDEDEGAGPERSREYVRDERDGNASREERSRRGRPNRRRTHADLIATSTFRDDGKALLANDERRTGDGDRDAFQGRANEYEQEFNDEEYLKPRPRKRRPPQNYEFALAAREATSSRPWARARGQSAPNLPTGKATESPFELKMLLKMQQREGSSLSEILQRRNLTLSDLLRGKAGVISALKAKDVDEFDAVVEQASAAMSNSLSSIGRVTTTNPTPLDREYGSAPDRTANYSAPGYLLKTGTVSSDSLDRILANVKIAPIEESASYSTEDSIGRVIDTEGKFARVDNAVLSNTAAKSSIVTAKFADARLGGGTILVGESMTTPSGGNNEFATTESVSLTPVSSVSTRRESDILPTVSTVIWPVTNASALSRRDDDSRRIQENNDSKTESGDEDEIMEFSDFTDFKKPKRIAPTTVRSFEKITDRHEDGSTLSIEQILSPTGRTAIVSNCSKNAIVNDSHPDHDRNEEIVLQSDFHPQRHTKIASEDNYSDSSTKSAFNGDASHEVGSEKEFNDESDENKRIVSYENYHETIPVANYPEVVIPVDQPERGRGEYPERDTKFVFIDKVHETSPKIIFQNTDDLTPNSGKVIEHDKYEQDQGDRMFANKSEVDAKSLEIPENSFFEMEYQDDAPVESQDNTEYTDVRTQSETNENYAGNHRANHDRAPSNHRVSAAEGKRYEDIISEIEPEARAEIFELFASGSSGKRLERLLKSRNMSLDELIALRQRGSSKVHLAEVSRLKEAKPKTVNDSKNDTNRKANDTVNYSSLSDEENRDNEKNNERNILTEYSDEPSSGYDEEIDKHSTASSVNVNDKTIQGNDRFSRFQRILNTDHEQDASNVNINDPPVNRDTNDEIISPDFNIRKESGVRDGHIVEKESQGHSKGDAQIMDLLSTFASLPFGKNLQQKFLPEQFRHETLDLAAKASESDETEKLDVLIFENRAKSVSTKNGTNPLEGFVEEVLAREQSNSIGSSAKGEGEEKRPFSKVKPSIIASGAILGVTIVVFLAILIACRVRQKQKYRYRNTFSRAVFQGPVMAARKLSNSSSLSTVMVNVVATSTAKRPDRADETVEGFDAKSDIDNDSLDANDSWETIPDYMK